MKRLEKLVGYVMLFACLPWLILAYLQPFERPSNEKFETLVHLLESTLALTFLITLCVITIILFSRLRRIAQSGNALKSLSENWVDYFVFTAASFIFSTAIILTSASEIPSIFKGYHVNNSFLSVYVPSIESVSDVKTFLLAFALDELSSGFISFTGRPDSLSDSLRAFPESASIFGLSMWLFSLNYNLVIVATFSAALDVIGRNIFKG